MQFSLAKQNNGLCPTRDSLVNHFFQSSAAPIIITTLKNSVTNDLLEKQTHKKLINDLQQNQCYNTSMPSNNVENTKKEQPKKQIPLTLENKKQIIKCMLKDKKIPEKIVLDHMMKLQVIFNDDERFEKLADEILASYDVFVLESYPNVDKVPRPATQNGAHSKSNRKTNQPIIHNVKSQKSMLPKQQNISKPKLIEDSSTLKTQKTGSTLATSAISPLGSNKAQKISSHKSSLAIPNCNIQPKKLDLKKVFQTGQINDIIKMINKYTELTIRNKSHHYDLNAINAIHKKLSLGKKIQSEEDLKSKERMTQIKDSLLRILLTTINKENNISIDSSKQSAPKYFIGKGNNSALVKSMMRDRWWWTSANDNADTNLLWTQWRQKSFIQNLKSGLDTPEKQTEINIPTVCNHLEGNYSIGNKKGLFKSLLRYFELEGKDVFEIIPLTFHITKGKSDESYDKFCNIFKQYAEEAKKAESQHNEDSEYEAENSNEVNEEEEEEIEEAPQYIHNIWIVKPGENTNRGNGILVSTDIKEIDRFISDKSHTYIIQKYIERPLLFEKRKFDIRCFGLITSVNGNIKGYYYNEGYLRTSSKEFSLSNLARSVHLTNEAIQIKYEDFGKHEAGNKVNIIFY